MIARLVAADALGDDIGLIVGILHRFQPDDRTLGKVVLVRGAVADRINVSQAGLAMMVDQHAVAAMRARLDKRRDCGNDADADDDEVGKNDLAGAEPNAGRMAVATPSI